MKIRHIDWYADEWLVGTALLTDVERGIYITICCLIYSRGAPIPDDEAELSRLCNSHWRTFRAARKRLIDLGKIVSEHGHVEVKRCSRELQKAFTRQSRSSQNGSMGGRPRKENNEIEKPDGSDREKLYARTLTTNHQPQSARASARGRRFANGKDDPFNLAQYTAQQLNARFNDKTITREERNAIRAIIAPNTFEPGF